MANIARLAVDLVAKTASFTRGMNVAGTSVRSFANQATSARTATAGLVTGLAAVGTGGLLLGMAKSFVGVSSQIQNYETRLKVLTGSQKTANKLFKEMKSYAMGTPFEFADIMESATSLAGILSPKEIMAWIPLIGDLAAASGLGIKDATEQIQRGLSAGAASMDLFQQRGVNAMLGFKAGVSYSAEETRRMIVNSWLKTGSQFKGATKELSKTWDGQVSMLSDAWFTFRENVMNAGVLEWLMGSLKKLTAFIDNNSAAVANVIRQHGDWIIAAAKTAMALVAVGTVAGGLLILLPGLAVVVSAVATSFGLMASGLGLAFKAVIVGIPAVITGLVSMGAAVMAAFAGPALSMGGVLAVVVALGTAVYVVRAVWSKNLWAIQGRTAEVFHKVKDISRSLWDTMSGQVGGFWNGTMKPLFMKIGEGYKKAYNVALGAFSKYATAIMAWNMGVPWADAIKAGDEEAAQDHFSRLTMDIQDWSTTAKGILGEVFGAVGEQAKEDFAGLKGMFADLKAQLINGLGNIPDLLRQQFPGVASWIDSLVSKFNAFGGDLQKALSLDKKNLYGDGFDDTAKKAKKAKDSISDLHKEMSPAKVGSFSRMAVNFGGGLGNKLSTSAEDPGNYDRRIHVPKTTGAGRVTGAGHISARGISYNAAAVGRPKDLQPDILGELRGIRRNTGNPQTAVYG